MTKTWWMAALCTCVFVSQTARADECIGDAARQALAQCAGVKKQAVNGPASIHVGSVPPGPGKKPRREVVPPPADPPEKQDRDIRERRLRPRQRKLLVTEIANLERLLASTPDNSADRPSYMRRLADDYVELEAAALRDKIEDETRAQGARTKDPKRAAAAKKRAEKAARVVKTARKQAIAHYKNLASKYPQWCQFPNNPPADRACTDEVLYYLAYEHEQAGDLEAARRVYTDLVQGWKQSRYAPSAYLAFAELFFQEAQGDPAQWDVAAKFYEEVMKYPAPENRHFAYAAYKLAYVRWNQGAHDKAIQGFRDVIELGRTQPKLPGIAGLVKSARRDILPVYALAGKPEKAWEFFKPLSGDDAGSNTATTTMTEDLGQILLDTGHYPEALVLYRDLVKRAPRGPGACVYQARITEAVMATQGGTKAPIVAALEEQVARRREFENTKNDDDAKLRCDNETAALLAETAMAWHIEAVGTGGVRGTNDPKTLEASAKLYRLVVSEFTADEFARFKFPRIVKEDWPSIPRVHYFLADLLWFQGKYDECGPAFDAALTADPKGPHAGEAAFTAAACYQKVYLAKHAGGSDRQSAGPPKDLKPVELDDAQKAMIGAFDRYLCHVEQPKSGDALEQYVEIKFARARTYFEAHHWEEAAWAFRDVAFNHPKAEAAIYAAELELESLNVMKSRLNREACLDQMAADVPKLADSLCSGPSRDEACSGIFVVERDVEAAAIARTVEACDKKPGPACLDTYEKAGDRYLALWTKRGEAACVTHEPACAGYDVILYDAARAYQAARLVMKAINVRKMLINAEYGLEKTEPARKAVYEIGGSYQAIAVYDLAADWYERFATESPTMVQAPDALSDAVVLRLGLGEADKALDDARLFQERHGRKVPAKAAQIAFAIGAHHAEHGDWSAAERSLGDAMRIIDANATVDVRLQAHAVLGRALAAQGKKGEADREYGRVRESFADPSAVEKALAALGGTEEQRQRRLAKTLLALGESLYHEADAKRAAADALAMPEYTGPGTRDDIQRFINAKVKPWMDKKHAAIEAAEKEFVHILEIKPAPPPRWVIAAGAAVGRMWGDFVNDMLRAPYPKEWDQKGYVPGVDPPLLWQELRDAYLAAIQLASEPHKERAKRAYQKCLDYSVTYQYFDEDSRSCEEWLGKNYPGEYHVLDELRDSPSRVSSGLDESPAALRHDGSPLLTR
jgi:tetratricopeptide (TPR) repeat protein